MLTSQSVNVYDDGMPDHGKLLARALATLRERAGMGQGKVAEQVGVTRQTVSRWENAKTGIEIPNLFALLDLYGADLYDLGKAAVQASGRAVPEEGPAGGAAFSPDQLRRLDEEAHLTAYSLTVRHLRTLRGQAEPDPEELES